MEKPNLPGPGEVPQGRSAMTYIAAVTFTVQDYSDEHLQDIPAIKAEVTTWLESLDATVHAVTVEAK